MFARSCKRHWDASASRPPTRTPFWPISRRASTCRGRLRPLAMAGGGGGGARPARGRGGGRRGAPARVARPTGRPVPESPPPPPAVDAAADDEAAPVPAESSSVKRVIHDLFEDSDVSAAPV